MPKTTRDTGPSISGQTRVLDNLVYPGARLHLAGTDSRLIVDGTISTSDTLLTAHDELWFIGPTLGACSGTATYTANGSSRVGTCRWSFSGATDQFVKFAFAPGDGWERYTVRAAVICPEVSPAGNMLWVYYEHQTLLGGNPGTNPPQVAATSAAAVPSGALGSTFSYIDIAADIAVTAVDLGAGEILPLVNGIIERNADTDTSTNALDIIGISVTRQPQG